MSPGFIVPDGFQIPEVPPHPGSKPSRWHWLARRDWRRKMDRRNAIKAARFARNYGAGPEVLRKIRSE